METNHARRSGAIPASAAISSAKIRPADRASQHPHLVAEHDVLELQLRHARLSGEQSDEANEDGVGEGSQGARDATYQRQTERNSVLDPHTRSCSPIRGSSPKSGPIGS